MGLQEMLDKATQNIITQGCQSLCENGCAYRGDNGTKCAVGHLISDEQIIKYNIKEGAAVHCLCSDLFEELAPNGKPELVMNFLKELQEARDSFDERKGDFVEFFIEKANEVANRYGLSSVKS